MVLAFCRRGSVIPICLYLLVGRYMKRKFSISQFGSNIIEGDYLTTTLPPRYSPNDYQSFSLSDKSLDEKSASTNSSASEASTGVRDELASSSPHENRDLIFIFYLVTDRLQKPRPLLIQPCFGLWFDGCTCLWIERERLNLNNGT